MSGPVPAAAGEAAGNRMKRQDERHESIFLYVGLQSKSI